MKAHVDQNVILRKVMEIFDFFWNFLPPPPHIRKMGDKQNLDKNERNQISNANNFEKVSVEWVKRSDPLQT